MAQDSDSTLKGVAVVDARVILSFPQNVLAKLALDTASLTAEVQGKFTFELRKLGLRVSTAAPNLLLCTVDAVTGPEISIIGYDVSVKFQEPIQIPRLLSSKPRWAITWHDDAVAVVGENNFRAAVQAKGTWCAEHFGNEWLAANPKR